MGDGTKRVVFPKGFTPSRKQLYIISCVARALPLSNDEEVLKTVHEFKTTVHQPAHQFERAGEPGYELTLSDRAWMARSLSVYNKLLKRDRFSRRIVHRISKIHPDDTHPFSGSSCVGYKRSEGGRAKDLEKYQILRPVDPKAPILTVNSEASRKNWSRVITRRYGSKAHKPAVADSVVLGVKERGYKVRVVTKNDPYRVARAHVFRRIVYPRIVRFGRTIVDEPPLFLPWKKKVGYVVFSGDLKKATDTFSFAWLRTLCMRLSLPPDLVFDHFTVEGKPTRRGAFMGLPLSWSLLDVTHHLICLEVDPSGDFIHKGDDIFAYWTEKQIKRWHVLCRFVGFEVNVKKSFKSKDGGTFCEACYFRRDDGLHIVPTLSVKSFVTSGNVDRYGVISSISDQAFRRGVDPKITNKLLGLFFPREFRFAKEKKLPIYLPAQLGGLGMIPEDPKRDLTLYESRWYWAVLEKDMPGLTVPAGLLRVGPFMEEVRRKMDNIKWRSSVRDEDKCPHLDGIIASNLERASARDFHLKPRRFSYTIEKQRLLKRFKKAVRLVDNPNETLWSVTRVTRMDPLMKTVDKEFKHLCKGVLKPNV
jgi:hypothetical protein